MKRTKKNHIPGIVRESKDQMKKAKEVREERKNSIMARLSKAFAEIASVRLEYGDFRGASHFADAADTMACYWRRESDQKIREVLNSSC